MLGDFEDASPAALAAYRNAGLPGSIAALRADPETMQRWTRYKSRHLVDFTTELAERARAVRGPRIKTARNLYAEPLLNPASEAWFAQNPDDFLDAYDWTAPMAMPYMEKVPAGQELAWLDRIVDAVARRRPDALDRTVFELQAVDWRTGPSRPEPTPVDTATLAGWMQRLQLRGARSFGYYPDDFARPAPAARHPARHLRSVVPHPMIDRLLALLILCAVLSAPFGFALALTSQALLGFVFFYPLFMSGLWMAGGSYYWWHWERHWAWGARREAPALAGNPLVSILVPCYNEADNGEDTLLAALNQNYPHIEVIAINDGSSDGTAQMLDRLAAQHERLRVVHLAQNQGKAMALRMGALAARSEYLVCIDGDAMLDPDAAAYLVAPLIDNPRVGAVTGNPRIRTRSTLIGRIQVGEFSSIIGLIKRTQRVYGQVFTVSGVVAAFAARRWTGSATGAWT